MESEIQQIASKLSRAELIAYVNRKRNSQTEFMRWGGVSRQAVHMWMTRPGRDTMTERARAWWVHQHMQEIEGICA